MKKMAYIILGSPSEAYYFDVPYYVIKDGDRLFEALESLQGATLLIHGLGKFLVRRVISEPFPTAGRVILSLYCEEVIDFEQLV